MFLFKVGFLKKRRPVKSFPQKSSRLAHQSESRWRRKSRGKCSWTDRRRRRTLPLRLRWRSRATCSSSPLRREEPDAGALEGGLLLLSSPAARQARRGGELFLFGSGGARGRLAPPPLLSGGARRPAQGRSRAACGLLLLSDSGGERSPTRGGLLFLPGSSVARRPCAGALDGGRMGVWRRRSRIVRVFRKLPLARFHVLV